MLKIIGQTFVKLAAFLAVACVATDGISSPAVPTRSGKVAVETDDAQIPLYSRPARSYVCTSIAPGTTTHKSEEVTLNAPNASEGYIMVRCTGSVGKTKMQITKSGSETYIYDPNNSGAYKVFPLSEGGGSYQVKALENIQGNQYSQVLSQNTDMRVTNQFSSFLYPNQYANFNVASAAVQTDAAIAADAPGQIGVVAATYSYAIDNISYDTAKAASVQSGYLPNVDVVLAQKKGVCFDYAALMTAIPRSQDIPTKLVVGYARSLYHAWISVYLGGQDWVDNIIYFDGNSWELMDPAFASSNGQSQEIIQYIGNGANYKTKRNY